jgi:hypothetical protein
MFKIITVAVVLVILGLFALIAYRAERIIAAQAEAEAEAQRQAAAQQPKSSKTGKTRRS